MSTSKDLTGKVFNRLAVIKYSHTDHNYRTYWECKCICGNNVIVRTDGLTTSHTNSCGCYRAERTSITTKTHGKSKDKIYKIWSSMIQRCENKNDKEFNNYGNRGIVVSCEWHEFDNFYKDMGDPPKGKSLDRIDNNKGYCNENCRWATNVEQCSNTRRNVIITYKGKSQILKRWAEELGINYETLKARVVRDKWEVEKAFTTPIRFKAVNI